MHRSIGDTPHFVTIHSTFIGSRQIVLVGDASHFVTIHSTFFGARQFGKEPDKKLRSVGHSEFRCYAVGLGRSINLYEHTYMSTKDMVWTYFDEEEIYWSAKLFQIPKALVYLTVVIVIVKRSCFYFTRTWHIVQ